MKHYILILSIIGIFSIKALSQEIDNKTSQTVTQNKQINIEEDAKKNVTDLKKIIKMTPEVENKVFHLFCGKYKIIMGYGDFSDDQKSILNENLLKLIGETSFKKLVSNKSFYESLINK